MVDSVSYLPGADGDEPDARAGDGRFGEPALIPVGTDDEEMIG